MASTLEQRLGHLFVGALHTLDQDRDGSWAATVDGLTLAARYAGPDPEATIEALVGAAVALQQLLLECALRERPALTRDQLVEAAALLFVSPPGRTPPPAPQEPTPS